MKKGSGLKFLGEEDFLIGIALLVFGGITFLISNENIFMQASGTIVLVLGLILASFGIGDYFRS